MKRVDSMHGPTYVFNDFDNDECILQLEFHSSPGLILGIKDSPMLLTKDKIAALLPLLQRFVDTGSIEEVGS